MSKPDSQPGRVNVSQEPKLAYDVLGREAYPLIKLYKPAIAAIPEFRQALTEGYFTEITHERDKIGEKSTLSGSPIYFERGGYLFGIKYMSGVEKEEITVIKQLLDSEGTLTEQEIVYLLASFNSENGEINFGLINYSHDVIDSEDNLEEEVHFNSQKAIQKIKEFLTANFDADNEESSL